MTIQPAGCSIAVGFATKGRAAVLVETIAEMSRQTQPPIRIIVSYTEPSDISGLVPAPGIELICTEAGLCHQRNVILDRLVDDAADIVLFFDDDFLPMPDYLSCTAQAFQDHPDIAVSTGEVLADGIKGPGLTVAYGRDLLRRQPAQAEAQAFAPALNGYGCNMAIRLSIVREHAMRFDEGLPCMAGWRMSISPGALGPMAASSKCRPHEACIWASNPVGAQANGLATPRWVNPIAIALKGVIPWRRALVSLSKNIIANSVRTLSPESYIDRRGPPLGQSAGPQGFGCGPGRTHQGARTLG